RLTADAPPSSASRATTGSGIGARARARARARAPRRPRRELVPVCRARTVHATSWAPRYEFARWQAGGRWAGALRQLLPPSALHRDVPDDVEVGGLGRDEAVVLEGEQVAVGVAEGAAAGGEPLDRQLGPLGAEVRAGGTQPVHERLVPRRAQPHPRLGAELGEEAAAVLLPVGQQVAQPGVGVDEPEQVAVARVELADRRVQPRVTGVPAD